MIDEIKQIFELHDRGLSYKQIKEVLRDQKIRSKGLKDKDTSWRKIAGIFSALECSNENTVDFLKTLPVSDAERGRLKLAGDFSRHIDELLSAEITKSFSIQGYYDKETPPDKGDSETTIMIFSKLFEFLYEYLDLFIIKEDDYVDYFNGKEIWRPLSIIEKQMSYMLDAYKDDPKKEQEVFDSMLQQLKEKLKKRSSKGGSNDG